MGTFAKRRITSGEVMLLTQVFADTLPYGELEVMTNFDDWGGADNSITPGDTPFMSTQIWRADFSDATVSDADRSTFIHEFTHVWQYFHGVTKLSALWLMVRHIRDYGEAYPYDLSDSDDLLDYNIEQQAAIVEDYWRTTRALAPLNNTGTDRSATSYTKYINQVKSAGPPHRPIIPRMQYRH